MRLTIIAVGLALMAGIAYADESQIFTVQKTISCTTNGPALIQGLATKFKEKPVISASGDDDAFGLVVLRSAPEQDTFTIVMILPNGAACGLVAGSKWHDLPKEPKK